MSNVCSASDYLSHIYHHYFGFYSDLTMFQGELSPELRDRQLELLESRYQGARLSVHRAATIIQTAWREHVLRTKFRAEIETGGFRGLN